MKNGLVAQGSASEGRALIVCNNYHLVLRGVATSRIRSAHRLQHEPRSGNTLARGSLDGAIRLYPLMVDMCLTRLQQPIAARGPKGEIKSFLVLARMSRDMKLTNLPHPCARVCQAGRWQQARINVKVLIVG